MILHELIDYEILRLIWWLLLGVLLIAFAATDGFDLGVGTLLPFVAKTDTERRVAINTIGPVWEGNQVWLILGGGAIFAAWPPLYAVSFSGFYLAMFAILLALILRPVGFKYRSKRESARWRSNWDWALFIGGFVPSLIFGVAVGNVLQGVPFRFDPADMRIFYEGSFFGLLNPYALLCGLLSVSMLVLHGASWLVLKTTGPVAERARTYGSFASLAVIGLFALGGIFLAIGVNGYNITSEINPGGPSNPLFKTATHDGSWLANYGTHPWMLIAPILGFAGAAAAFLALRARWEVAALLFSKLSIFGIISTVGLSMFPFILPSSLEPNSSLTVWDASSSHSTLFTMLVVSVIFLPIIFAYTAWVYKVLWGKVDEKTVTDKSGHAY
ncbi:cytochrome d ubiquinol oxidase subunit II [Rhizobium sp. BK181]|uniref:cytochrome d ubiquinol oxidase subunit II n=1 Tax=Rhizobium sp. BK181 TaxID=2587072 RepID=UPI00160F8ED7|nr:cytochrome d ubiquinol oxidase subunit II [Rhizobium sp. BK181]MBB3315966.1 cytochrome d ubiquinol oxidase subunit II [Rhizobium sp. BK181]